LEKKEAFLTHNLPILWNACQFVQRSYIHSMCIFYEGVQACRLNWIIDLAARKSDNTCSQDKGLHRREWCSWSWRRICLWRYEI